jgi:two-component system alkaline phosphatase synthesis response regulator PhoP
MDLVILDEMLPGMAGFEVLKTLRARSHEVLAPMLTARGQEMDKVRGLKLGADDYVTKPFSLMELLARVAALLRRSSGREATDLLEVGDIVVHFRARQASRAGQSLTLTGREFHILEMLTSRRGEAVSRGDLISRIWGTSTDIEVSTRTIDQHIASLRRKLGDDASHPTILQTVYGYGYRLRG